MLPLKTTISGTFQEKLEQRRAQWSSVHQIAAVVTVPDDMIWWVYNEFGTAPHSIDAKNGLLIFPDTRNPGETVKTPHVDHPGTRASHMVALVEERCKDRAIEDLHNNLPPNFSPEEYKAVLMDSTMPAIKEIIRSSFEATLSDKVRIDGGGKLGSQTAAEVFEEKAFISDKSS
jgi:hypothetical protein